MHTKITLNVNISRPHWEFVAGHGWRTHDIQHVVAFRFGPDGVFMGSAGRLGSAEDAKATCLSVKFIVPGQIRIASKRVATPLKDISNMSLVQHWGRMITFAKKWPDWPGTKEV